MVSFYLFGQNKAKFVVLYLVFLHFWTKWSEVPVLWLRAFLHFAPDGPLDPLGDGRADHQ